MRRTFFYALTALIFLASPLSAAERVQTQSIETLAVQHDGRVKPFLTFSREILYLISGKKSFKGENAPTTALKIFFKPNEAKALPLIPITFKPLVDTFNAPAGKKYFTLEEVQQNEAFFNLYQEARTRKETGIKETQLDQKIKELSFRVEMLLHLSQGKSVRMLPPLNEEVLDWNSLEKLDQYDTPTQQQIAALLRTLGESLFQGNQALFDKTAGELIQTVRGIAPERYPTELAFKIELAYEKIKPFQKSWILYFLSFLIFALFPQRNKVLAILGWGAALGGFLFHTAGLILRVIIGGRAPVSNMYESILFLGWALVLFSLLFALYYRSRLLIGSGMILGFLVLVIADLLPISSSIGSLVPVLRSNYWLTIHVLTIVASYGAFALAMGIGHFNLGLLFFAPQRPDLLREGTRFLYRVIQVGLVLLIAGTILGGVWANESWGRFWGWDPKETWALISILGYLVIVHGRYAGWLKEFGLAICSLLGFLLILMTYYGVNFVLGQGLHSYGFGAGGTGYALSFVIVELVIILAAALRYRQIKAKR